MELSAQMSFSNASCPEYQYTKIFIVWFSIFYSIICIVGITMNTLGLYTICKGMTKTTSTLLYLINLILADLLFAIVLPLRIVYFAMGLNWKLGEIMCRLYGYLFYVNIYTSINFMVCISVDRCLAVFQPLELHKFRKISFAKCVCVFVWIFTCATNGVIFFLPNIYIQNGTVALCMEISNVENNPKFSGQILTAVIFSYYIPFLILFCCYCCVGVKLCKLSRNPVSSSSGRSHRKSLRMVIAVLLVFIVCYTPYNITLTQHMIKILRGNVSCDDKNSFKLYLQSTMSVMNLSFILDPFIYFASFKFQLSFLFKCRENESDINLSSASKKASATEQNCSSD
ncbi:G-protein coupled receptor 183 [Amia ocellicauda]|uniref:G-protein coupled receptor 183 n=1 Tax=Amia ocellicauda TaxID=2972642 RepID=UPI0034649408